MAQADNDKKLDKFKAANQKLEEIQKVVVELTSTSSFLPLVFPPMLAKQDILVPESCSLYHLLVI